MYTHTAALPQTSNRILNALIRSEFESLSPHLDPINLSSGEILYRPEQPVTHVYFPDRGTVSLVYIGLMEEERFSLYVIDGQLPDVGGLSFCEESRRKDKTTPVVFFTGKAYESDREAGMLAGADAYVVKPDAGELVPTVRRLLEETRRG